MLTHENVLEMHGQFVDGLRVYIVLEYATEGDFRSKLLDCGKFTEHEAANVNISSFINTT